LNFRIHRTVGRGCPACGRQKENNHGVALLTFTILFSLFSVADAFPDDSTYNLTLAGKKCKVWGSEQTISCKYTVGTGLRFSIDGVGKPDTGITFMKSSFDGDFYATYGMQHGCIIVKRGKKARSNTALSGPGSISDYAFVSPKNGKVYRGWQECEAGF